MSITYPADAPIVSDGLYGQFRRIQQAVLELKKHHAGIVLTEALGTMESTGRSITYYPWQFRQRIDVFRTHYSNLLEVLKEQKLNKRY